MLARKLLKTHHQGATPKEKEEKEESKVESTTTVPEVETAEPESAVNGGSDQAAASAEAVTEAAAEATPEVVTADAPAVTSESEVGLLFSSQFHVGGISKYLALYTRNLFNLRT